MEMRGLKLTLGLLQAVNTVSNLFCEAKTHIITLILTSIKR